MRHDNQAHFSSPWRLPTTGCAPDATFVIHAPNTYFPVTLSSNATSPYPSPLMLPLSTSLPQLYFSLPLSSNATYLQLSPTMHFSHISLLQFNLSKLILEFRHPCFTVAIYCLFIFYSNGQNESVSESLDI